MRSFKAVFILVVTLCSFTPISSYAAGQEIKAFGFKGGLTFSNLSGDKSESETGSSFGAFIDVAPKDYPYASLSFELNLTNRKSILRDTIVLPYGYSPDENRIPFYSYDFYISFKYLELPILIKLNIPINNEFMIHPYVGYSFCNYYDQETKGNNMVSLGFFDGDSLQADVRGIVDPAYDNISGLIIGCSFQYSKILMDFRYFATSKNVNMFGSLKTMNNKYKWRTLTISLGLLFK